VKPAIAIAILMCALTLPTVAAQIPDDVTLDPLPGVPDLPDALGLKHAGDGSGRLFIVRQGGEVRIIDAGGDLLATPFIDVSSLLTTGGFEQGLFDIAFHPEYALPGADGEGLFYLHFSSDGGPVAGTDPGDPGDTVVAEFSVSGDPNVANAAAERLVLTVSQDFGNHNGGQMRFGPDGYLYLGLGDGGSGNDPCNRAQTLDPDNLVDPGNCFSGATLNDSLALLGKMLRVDVGTTTPAGANNLCGSVGDGSAGYAVPPENPFAGQADRCGEVLLYGLRNPWRWSFDRQTQDMWIGDVGQGDTEEISLLEWPLAGGDNLGWKICEGSTLTGSSTTPCTDPVQGLPGSIIPVLEYPTGAAFGRSVTGGYRYRGPVTSLQGTYIFGDAVSGNIWFATEDAGNWSFELFDSTGASVRSFGEDEAGNVYAIAGGTILRFNGDLELIFANGFED